jgi:hypothetical protein
MTIPDGPSMGEQSMTRQFLSFRLAVFAAALSGVAPAFAVEIPPRKPGLWEIKLPDGAVIAWRGNRDDDKTNTRMALEMTMQHCTDETTDKQMNPAFLPTAKEYCSKHDIEKTSTGYITDLVCTVRGMSMTSHSEITGDFNSAYTVRFPSHNQGGAAGAPRDITKTIEARWLGPCRADQKPGDILMPGGYKVNVKDTEKMKGPLPK